MNGKLCKSESNGTEWKEVIYPNTNNIFEIRCCGLLHRNGKKTNLSDEFQTEKNGEYWTGINYEECRLNSLAHYLNSVV